MAAKSLPVFCPQRGKISQHCCIPAPPPFRLSAVFVVYLQFDLLKKCLKLGGALVVQCKVLQINQVQDLFVGDSDNINALVGVHGDTNFLHSCFYEYACDGRVKSPDFSSFIMIGFKDEAPTWLKTGTQV